MKKKKIPFYKNNKLYTKLNYFFWTIYTKLDRKGATKLRHKRVLGYEADLENPKTLNEKMQWLKLNTYYKNDLVRRCTDKILVRDYVKEKGCGEILNELYFVVDNVDDIDEDRLPQKFALKSNSGSTGNIICKDKSKFNLEEHKPFLRKLLKDTNYGPRNVEFSYDGIDIKLLCEKFIETEHGGSPIDYKIFCNYGKPKFMYVASNRDKEETFFDMYTPEWEWLDVHTEKYRNTNNSLKKPDNLDELLKYASKLSEDFPLVRVDLYSEFGKVIFGELTFLANSGKSKFVPIEYDKIFGDMFDISEELKKYS